MTGSFGGTTTVTGMMAPATSATVNLGSPGEVGPILVTLIGSTNGEL